MDRFDKQRVTNKFLGVIPNPMSVGRKLDRLGVQPGVPFSVGALRRSSTNMSQPEFAEAFQINLPTLRKWELNPKMVTPACMAYLSIIAKAPDTVLFLLNNAPTKTAAALGKDTDAVKPEVLDLKHLRKVVLGLSREQFALQYGLRERTLEKWEYKPERMTQPVRAYMLLVDKAPELIRKLLIASTKEEVNAIVAGARE